VADVDAIHARCRIVISGTKRASYIIRDMRCQHCRCDVMPRREPSAHAARQSILLSWKRTGRCAARSQKARFSRCGRSTGRNVKLSDLIAARSCCSTLGHRLAVAFVEIPWFVEFHQAYRDRGLVVLGFR